MEVLVGKRKPRPKAPPTEADFFRAYAYVRRILIVDDNASHRMTLAQVAKDMGFRPGNVVLATNLESAKRELLRFQPHFVIADFDLAGRCGLELLEEFRVQLPETEPGSGGVFVVLTANSQRATLGRVAEENVDAFILKPFNVQALKRSLIQTVLIKVRASGYTAKLERLRERLQARDTRGALSALGALGDLDPSRCLGLIYRDRAALGGKSKRHPASPQLSDQDYAFYKFYYRYLVELFEQLSRERMDEEAYAVVRRMAPFFPANPARLPVVVKLACRCRAWADLDEYYQAYTETEARPARLRRRLCAALFLGGKALLREGEKTLGLEWFRRSAMIAGTLGIAGEGMLRRLIVAILREGLTDEAYQFLKRFPPEAQGGIRYQTIEYMILDTRISEVGMAEVIRRGRELISRGVHHPLIYHILIRRYVEAGSARSVEALAYQAAARYPRRRAEFIAYAEQRRTA